MNKRSQTILYFLIFIFGCQYNSRPTAEALFHFTPAGLDNYNLKDPDAKYFLPYVLEEISGMTYYENGVIACVQDEDGKVFFYDHQERELVNTVRFDGSGDYEGIAYDGDKLYVAQSNGDIFQFEIDQDGEVKKKKQYNTSLKKNNDVEGLAFDKDANKLFIACKGDAGINGNKKKKGKAIYGFSKDKKDVKSKPEFVITKKDIKQYLEESKDFEYEENRINFNPSGIALHPINKHFYIIASVGKLLIITDRSGKIKGSIPLDPRLLGQPEGICFAPNGDMFISSEGQGDKGYILKFNMN